MLDKINNSAKVNTASASAKDATTISPEAALQMLKEDKIKPDSLQVSDKGVATFKDHKGNSFRTELSKEQVAVFQTKPVTAGVNIPAEHKTPGKISLSENMASGSAKPFASIFDDKAQQSELKINKPDKKDNPDNQWKFTANFGFNRIKYFDTDMHLKSSRLDVTIKDFTFKERTSAEYFNPKNWQGIQDAGRWIDEPTNGLTLTASKNKNVFFASVNHPKFLKEDFQTRNVTGTVDGVKVDQMMPINEEFDGYNDQPGQMHLVRFENTYRQMDVQLGYGRDITVADAHKYGKLVYTPSVHAGISAGYSYAVYTKPNEYWQFDDHRQDLSIQGANVSVGNKLRYEYGRANIFVENKFTFSHFKHEFMDGTAEYDMKYNSTMMGLGFQLNKNKKKPAVPVSE